MFERTKDYLSSRYKPLILGVAVMGGFWLSNDPSSNVIASSPDRIIPSVLENTMVDGALNPNLFEVRTCKVDYNAQGDVSMFVVYGNEKDKERDENGRLLLASLGPEGSIVLTPYEGDKWRCGRPRF